MDMSISSLSISASQISTNNDVGVAMVKKSLDTIEQNGESLQKMMEASVTPYLGQNIDYSV